jgi:hypothetical protein
MTCSRSPSIWPGCILAACDRALPLPQQLPMLTGGAGSPSRRLPTLPIWSAPGPASIVRKPSPQELPLTGRVSVGVNLDDEQASSIGTGEIDALRSEQLESTRKLVRPIHPNLDKVRFRLPPPICPLKHLRRPSTSCERAPAFLPGLPRHAMPCALYSGLPICPVRFPPRKSCRRASRIHTDLASP